MAANNPYHIVPEDEPSRPSIETIPGDDQRLLDSDSLYEEPSTPTPPTKGKKSYKMKVSYCPTFHLRLLVLCLLITAISILGVHAASEGSLIPTIVFTSFAIPRLVVVLYNHAAGHCLIRVRIEFVGRTTTQRLGGTKTKNWLPSWISSSRLIGFVVDWTCIIIVLIVSVVGYCTHRYDWRYRDALAGGVLIWIALPIWALTTIDMGTPSRLTCTHVFTLDPNEEKDNKTERAILPQTYRDIEASGGLQEELSPKIGGESSAML